MWLSWIKWTEDVRMVERKAIREQTARLLCPDHTSIYRHRRGHSSAVVGGWILRPQLEIMYETVPALYRPLPLWRAH
jgi:hypothetical protein